MTPPPILIEVPSDQRPYKAEAIIFGCFDARIKAALDALGRRYYKPDENRLAGGAKVFLEKSSCEFALGEISKSAAMHQTPKVVLTLHIDCGACGGSSVHENEEREFAYHEKQLRRAANVVRSNFPGMSIEGYVISFSGIHSADMKAE